MGKEGRKKRGREGGRDEGRAGGREEVWDEGREGGREGRNEGGRKGRREGGMEEGREGRREEGRKQVIQYRRVITHLLIHFSSVKDYNYLGALEYPYELPPCPSQIPSSVVRCAGSPQCTEKKADR